MKLAERVSTLRRVNNLSARQLATLVGVAPTTITRIESGAVTAPNCCSGRAGTLGSLAVRVQPTSRRDRVQTTWQAHSTRPALHTR